VQNLAGRRHRGATSARSSTPRMARPTR
jgi:hypothetical protein